MRWTLFVAAMLALPGAARAQQSAADTPADAPIEVMVLGTFHFANPGQDVANARIDPVTTATKQVELADLARRIEAFRPTVVAVEREADDPETLIDPVYPSFTPAMLTSNVNERVQIGYRIAHDLGLSTVYAIDEQPGPGEPSYFPMTAVRDWAGLHGKATDLDATLGQAQGVADWLEESQRSMTIVDMLVAMNTGDSPYAAGTQSSFYYRMMGYGGADGLPGAELNGRWYMRNAKIWAKLLRVVSPGDRVLIVYGAGHNYWLRHFASETPGFRLIEANAYLEPASATGE